MHRHFGEWGTGGGCAIEGKESYWQWRVSGMRCTGLMTRDKENTKHLKCINFSAFDRTTCYFSGWAQKSWALRSSLECNFTELPPLIASVHFPFLCIVHPSGWWSGRLIGMPDHFYSLFYPLYVFYIQSMVFHCSCMHLFTDTIRKHI